MSSGHLPASQSRSSQTGQSGDRTWIQPARQTSQAAINNWKNVKACLQLLQNNKACLQHLQKLFSNYYTDNLFNKLLQLCNLSSTRY